MATSSSPATAQRRLLFFGLRAGGTVSTALVLSREAGLGTGEAMVVATTATILHQFGAGCGVGGRLAPL